LVHGNGPSMAEVMKHAQNHMQMFGAMQRLQGTFPSEVVALMQEGQPFDEKSHDKSRIFLNDMAVQAWLKLHNKGVQGAKSRDMSRRCQILHVRLANCKPRRQRTSRLANRKS